jgi:hypothetical protein
MARLSAMTVGEEKRLEMACRSYYLIKRVDKDYYKVKLYNKKDEVLEKYKIPAKKIDEIFKAY